MTVLEAIQKTSDFLAQKGVESARLNAELLLSHQLKLPRMKLYLNFERTLTVAETDGLRELVKRRGNREPLQHITGSTSFCGCEIAVSRSALIPRPETELLAELGWKFLGRRNSRPASALDFGTGTGCIAIALAANSPGAKISALDISSEALALAKQNALANHVADRIDFLAGNGFTTLNADIQFDLVISNPPYIPTAEIETLQPEVRDYDPHAALDGGADGLFFYRQLAAQARQYLKVDGKLMVELGDDQAEAVSRIFLDEKWIVEAVQADYSQRARILIAQCGSEPCRTA